MTARAAPRMLSMACVTPRARSTALCGIIPRPGIVSFCYPIAPSRCRSRRTSRSTPGFLAPLPRSDSCLVGRTSGPFSTHRYSEQVMRHLVPQTCLKAGRAASNPDKVSLPAPVLHRTRRAWILVATPRRRRRPTTVRRRSLFRWHRTRSPWGLYITPSLPVHPGTVRRSTLTRLRSTPPAVWCSGPMRRPPHWPMAIVQPWPHTPCIRRRLPPIAFTMRRRRVP